MHSRQTWSLFVGYLPDQKWQRRNKRLRTTGVFSLWSPQSKILITFDLSPKFYLQVISPFQNLTWERDDACRTETCMWRLMRSTRGLGPVTNPSLIPELNTFENESNRKTRPSVSRDKKLGARFSANLKIKIKYLKETIWRVGIQS